MIGYSIKEKYIRKDSWVKSFRKTYDPEPLAELIKKRIEYPMTYGPFVRQDETPTDIIDAFIIDDRDVAKKVAPAIGLLIWRMMHGELGESHEILRGAFSIIKESRLIACSKLVDTWLKEKYSSLISDDPKWKATYREGLMAYARIQPKDPVMEEWWSNLWRESLPVWWAVAFLGLRIQNPDRGAKELPLLMQRKLDKTPYLLVGMWSEIASRSAMEWELKLGLSENSGWAGLALNMLIEKLSEDDQKLLMSNLKTLDIDKD